MTTSKPALPSAAAEARPARPPPRTATRGLSLGNGRRGRGAQIALCERDESGPVGAGRVSAGVLAESYVAIDKRGFDRGEFAGSHILFAEEFVDRARAGSGEEHAFGIDPSIAFGRARADEDGARRAESYQFVGIDRQIVPVERASVLEEVARHPVIFVGSGNVLDEFTPVAAMQLQATFAGGTDEGNGETLIVGKGDGGGFA